LFLNFLPGGGNQLFASCGLFLQRSGVGLGMAPWLDLIRSFPAEKKALQTNVNINFSPELFFNVLWGGRGRGGNEH
jgi:hypothetical protein